MNLKKALERGKLKEFAKEHEISSGEASAGQRAIRCADGCNDQGEAREAAQEMSIDSIFEISGPPARERRWP